MFAAVSNSSFYIIFALGPGFIARISQCVSTASQEFSFEDSAWDRLAFQLCGFRQLLLHQPLCQQHDIRRVNAEEDVQDLCLLLPGLDPSQGVMLLLQFLDLQASGQFRSDVIQLFVVRQRMRRINQDVTEQLVVDVPVQLLHQLRETHLRLHLQEHQRHFPLRGEVGLPSTLRSHALAHQPETLCHLMQREELLHPAQFTVLKRFPVQFIKIELREWEIWCNLNKISYLRHTNF